MTNTVALLGKKHTGMRVDYSGLLGQAQRSLNGCRDHANAEMLQQLQNHLQELGMRWYAGDTGVVDEFLQLYCIAGDEREAVQASAPEQTLAPNDELCDALIAALMPDFDDISYPKDRPVLRSLIRDVFEKMKGGAA